VTPHPPHCHEHEELHISLSENLEFVFCETDSGSEKARPIDNGSVFYTRSNIPHSFRNTASQPAAYLHFRWKSKSEATRTEMKRLQFYYSPAGQREMSSSPGRDGVDVIELYNGPSLYLTRFRALFVRMAAGGVIPLHRHSHETIFAFVSGSVGFLGRNVDAPGFAFTGTQMPHSIINQCTETAQFYAFELHQEA
jgi:mannose-6-phosphate isomerase-like protein (cupin superfamily)